MAARKDYALRRENERLAKEVAVLRNGPPQSGDKMKNDLSGLVAMMSQQTNLTSFNPIISNNIYAPLTIDWQTLTYMFKTHGIIQTAIEMPVLDALRGGLDIKSAQLDPEDIKKLLDFMEYKRVLKTVGMSKNWARLFGGGALLLSISDQNPGTPLNPKKIPDLKFYSANRWELGAGYKAKNSEGLLNTPIESYNSLNAEFYDFYGQRVHRSRVLTMTGKEAPHLIRWQLQGWGMSEVERMVEDFNAYIRTKNVIYELLEEAKVDVYRMEGFNSTLMTDNGTAQIFNRIQKANQLKSFRAGLILDKLDEYETKQITFSGLADIMKENRLGMANATRIPFSKLFGTTAGGGGLANSGQDDLENYNALVESEVREDLKPVLRDVINLCIVHLFGREMDFDFSFKPLRVMTSTEEETVKTSKQARRTALYSLGLMTPEETMNELAADELVPLDTQASKGLMEGPPDVLFGDDKEDDGKGDDKKKGGKDGADKDK